MKSSAFEAHVTRRRFATVGLGALIALLAGRVAVARPQDSLSSAFRSGGPGAADAHPAHCHCPTCKRAPATRSLHA
jgi:hypothetical protein